MTLTGLATALSADAEPQLGAERESENSGVDQAFTDSSDMALDKADQLVDEDMSMSMLEPVAAEIKTDLGHDDHQSASIDEDQSVISAHAPTQTHEISELEKVEKNSMSSNSAKDTILSDVTETASADAFASLSKAVEDNVIEKESGPRIGDIVQDALRPMLKEWLDENLSGIVERAVQKEVKRISSGK